MQFISGKTRSQDMTNDVFRGKAFLKCENCGERWHFTFYSRPYLKLTCEDCGTMKIEKTSSDHLANMKTVFQQGEK